MTRLLLPKTTMYLLTFVYYCFSGINMIVDFTFYTDLFECFTGSSHNFIDFETVPSPFFLNLLIFLIIRAYSSKSSRLQLKAD